MKNAFTQLQTLSNNNQGYYSIAKNLFTPPKFVKLTLVGLDGNAFSLMGEFRYRAKKQGWTDTEIDKVIEECESSDYQHLLATLSAHCTDPEEVMY